MKNSSPPDGAEKLILPSNFRGNVERAIPKEGIENRHWIPKEWEDYLICISISSRLAASIEAVLGALVLSVASSLGKGLVWSCLRPSATKVSVLKSSPDGATCPKRGLGRP
jgi:hypothetical protein